MYTNIKRYTENRTILDKIVPITFTLSYDYDDIPVEYGFDFGSKEENEEYLKKFELGELLNVVIKIEASYLGLEGTDYLGSCHVRSRELESDIQDIVKDHLMVEEAFDELSNNVIRLVNQFK
jgi:CRISPR/Cas system CSM-associated protein Csm3 (group 7 of RAMP superfamily)